MIKSFLTNNYWGKLEDMPQTMIDFIKTSNEMKTLWGETFLRDNTTKECTITSLNIKKLLLG